MVLYLELLVELSDHLVIEIGTIVRNDPLWYTVSTDQIMPNELCHDVLGYSRKGSCFNPLRKVINSYQDETMPVRCSRSDFTNYVNAPHCKRPQRGQDFQRNGRNMHFVSIHLALVANSTMVIAIIFYGGPIATSSQNIFDHGMSSGVSLKGNLTHLFNDFCYFILVHTTKTHNIMISFVQHTIVEEKFS